MVSQKQLDANRRNAARSTGPKTAAGKEASSRNAVTHGLTARKIPVLQGEDSAEFEALRDALVRDLRPVGVLQREIVDDIAMIRWKLRRVPRVEAALAQRQILKVARRDKFAREDGLIPKEFPQQVDAVAVLAVKFECQSEKSFAQLEIYRQRLERSMHGALRELRKLREETAGEEETTLEEKASVDRSSDGDGASNDGPDLSTDGDSATFKNEAVSDDNSLSRQAFTPSPGTPGEGWDEGLRFSDPGVVPKTKTLTLPSPGVPGEDSKAAHSSQPESLPNTDSPNISGR